jgi:hypothetical protein
MGFLESKRSRQAEGFMRAQSSSSSSAAQQVSTFLCSLVAWDDEKPLQASGLVQLIWGGPPPLSAAWAMTVRCSESQPGYCASQTIKGTRGTSSRGRGGREASFILFFGGGGGWNGLQVHIIAAV